MATSRAQLSVPFLVPAHVTLPLLPPPRPASGSGRGAPRCCPRRRRCARSASSRRARTRRPPARGSSQQSQRENSLGPQRERERGSDLEARGDGDGDVLGKVGPSPRGGRRRRELHFARSPFPRQRLYQCQRLTAIPLFLHVIPIPRYWLGNLHHTAKRSHGLDIYHYKRMACGVHMSQ
jgi:hypothetical protein